MHTTPVSLLERLRRSEDSDAWARFVQLATPFLYDVARRNGLQEADAADVVQDVFVVLSQKLASFQYEPDRSFRSWLRTILLNRCRDRRRRHSTTIAAAGSLAIGDGVCDPAKGFADDEYCKALAMRALRLMQTEFAESTWRACWEQVVNERPAADVARDLGISVNMAYLARSRVLARLRQELAGLVE